jgi:hypothetical protein
MVTPSIIVPGQSISPFIRKEEKSNFLCLLLSVLPLPMLRSRRTIYTSISERTGDLNGCRYLRTSTGKSAYDIQSKLRALLISFLFSPCLTTDLLSPNNLEHCARLSNNFFPATLANLEKCINYIFHCFTSIPHYSFPVAILTTMHSLLAPLAESCPKILLARD